MLLLSMEVVVVLLADFSRATVVNADMLPNSFSLAKQTLQRSATPTTLEDNIFKRVDVIALEQLLSFAGMIRPYSCWCTNANTTCPVHIPVVPLHKVLNVSCDDLSVYCCKERDLPIRTNHMVTTAEDLSRFLDTTIDSLRPQKSKILVESRNESLPEKGFHSLYNHSSPQVKIEARYRYINETVKTDHTSTQIRNIEDKIILALKDIVDHLLAASAQLHTVKLSRQKRTLVSSSENTAEEINSLETGDNTSSSIQKIQLTSEHNISNAVFAMNDLAVPYDSLGWFSKVVEKGIDISMHVVIMVVVMLVASQVVAGVFHIIQETCLICNYIGYANVAGIA
ncbi:uncharacterized protein [Cherax quadricarinatus]